MINVRPISGLKFGIEIIWEDQILFEDEEEDTGHSWGLDISLGFLSIAFLWI